MAVRTGGTLAGRWWHTTAPETQQTDSNGNLYRYASTTGRALAPCVVRYGLTPPGSRWRVEALTGVLLLHTRTETQLSFTPAGQPVRPFEASSTDELNDAPLLLGASVGYALTPHWRVRADASANWSLFASFVGAVFGGRSTSVQPGYSASVQYGVAWPSRRHKQEKSGH